ncbi:acetyltransferase (GNAT) family protein [Corynebacterium testudinoris]|uniref:Acetyltransferase (GNAT) family protein n=2 Tax=Corynebacterium testudinoris TaxID=136857 RepID=A0A0G3H3N7_9CORY|nr:acetyltransferase (GNAT) family protein [Corynebacterium testudinoris]
MVPMSDFHLRPATESDRTYLERLFHLADVWGDESQAPGEGYADDLAMYVDAWTPDQGGIIAYQQRVPAGGLWLRSGTDRRPPYGFVAEDIPELAIAVEAAFGGLGLGRELLNAALDLARKQGRQGLSLAVDEGNERARRLYEKIGFEVAEERPELHTTTMVTYF